MQIEVVVENKKVVKEGSGSGGNQVYREPGASKSMVIL